MRFLIIMKIIVILKNNIYKLMLIPFTPYSLYGISVSNKILQEDEKSETWQFYNPALGIAFYAPFLAIINTPAPAATLTAFFTQVM